MSTQVRVVKKDALYIPIKDLSRQQQERITEKLTFHFVGKEATCEACEFVSERYSDICERCANYGGCYELSKKVKIGENRYMKLPIGSGLKVLESVGIRDINLIDKARHVPVEKYRFLGKLKEGQLEFIKAMWYGKRGVLIAPPRSGKTVMCTVLACKMGVKTLILASQVDWLNGFKETFIGSKTQKALTDIDPKRIKLCKTLEDFRAHDVCLATVQSFYSPSGMKLLEKIRSLYGLILIDEIQTANADKYIGIVAKFNTRLAIGVSGTPERKDRKEILIENVLGPVLHEMKTERVRPTIKLTRTPYTKDYKGQVLWTRIVSSLENDKKRQLVIAKQVIEDVKAGHMILLPCAQIKPMKALVAKINELAGKTIAYEFAGANKKDREGLIARARDYKIKVLVGTQKVISVGVNIPRASCLYETVLSSNRPNCTQRIARVLTPMPGTDKPDPIVRYFLDDFAIRKNCLRMEFWQVMMPVFKPIIHPDVERQLLDYFKNTSKVERSFDL